MKKICAVLLSAALLLAILPMGVFSVSAATSGTCGNNLTWSYNTSTATLTISGTGAMWGYDEDELPWWRYRSSIKTVNIGNGVTTISHDAFEDCTGLTSITIGNSVTTIGSYAFEDCKGLTSITIPDSVTTIGYKAFYSCTGLTSVTIPDSVTTVGDGAFYGCTGLTGITVSSGNPVYHSADNCLIETKSKTLVLGCKNSIIPADGSVTTIGNYAFDGCTGLTSITIPDSVTTIGDYAFEDCTGLTSITIPDGVTSIGSLAFEDCKGLTSITIPDSVTTIGDWAFSGCTNLTSVTIPASVTSIDNGAFYGCPVTIYGEAGSYAERYAAANGFTFVPNPVKMKVFSVPDKVVYNVGEELNVEGLIVAVYLPNKRLEWYYDDFCTISCDDFSTTGTKTVTLTYLGVSATFTVTVQNGGMAPLPTTTDMVRLMRALLGEEEISASADYNADGTVDVRDLVRAKKLIAG